MTKSAWISLVTFVVLLVLVFATREDQVSVGVRVMDLSVDAAKVTRIEVKAGEKTALLEKVGGTDAAPQWTVADPAKADVKHQAEPSAVKAALDALGELSAEGFVTGRAAKHADLEIDDEKGTTVKITAGAQTVDLVFGRFAKGGGNYVRRAGTDEVFIGKGRFAATVKKDVKGWRKRKLLAFEAKDLRSLVVEAAGRQTLTLKGEAGEGDTVTWALDGVTLPEGFRLDLDALGRVATTVASLRAADFKDEGELGEVIGSVSGKTLDDQTFKITFGAKDEKNRIAAQIEGDPQLYLISEYTVKNALKELDGLRDLKLITFDAAKATKVEINSPEGRVVVEKGDEGWALIEPQSPPGYEFDPSQVEPKLSALTRLKASSLVGTETVPVKKPADKVTLMVTTESGVQALTFGDEVPKAEGEKGGVEHYAYGTDGFTYKVGQWQRNRYAKGLELFKKPAAPKMPPGGGGIPGMENLPPELRKQLEAQLKQQGLPGR
jgi:hypothetical protein